MPTPTIPELIARYERDLKDARQYGDLQAAANFESFLTDLRSLPEPGLKWVKASERMPGKEQKESPNGGMVVCRFDETNAICYHYSILPDFPEHRLAIMSWLDESPSPVDAVEAVDPVALLEWIDSEGWCKNNMGDWFKHSDPYTRYSNARLTEIYKTK